MKNIKKKKKSVKLFFDIFDGMNRCINLNTNTKI